MSGFDFSSLLPWIKIKTTIPKLYNFNQSYINKNNKKSVVDWERASNLTSCRDGGSIAMKDGERWWTMEEIILGFQRVL
jgi:hypothetical protein